MQEKDKYIDEYMKMYDKKIKYFGQEGYNFGRKATSWLKYKLDDSKRIAPLEGDKRTEAMKAGYEWLKKSIDEQGMKPNCHYLYCSCKLHVRFLNWENCQKKL